MAFSYERGTPVQSENDIAGGGMLAHPKEQCLTLFLYRKFSKITKGTMLESKQGHPEDTVGVRLITD